MVAPLDWLAARISMQGSRKRCKGDEGMKLYSYLRLARMLLPVLVSLMKLAQIVWEIAGGAANYHVAAARA